MLNTELRETLFLISSVLYIMRNWISLFTATGNVDSESR